MKTYTFKYEIKGIAGTVEGTVNSTGETVIDAVQKARQKLLALFPKITSKDICFPHVRFPESDNNAP